MTGDERSEEPHEGTRLARHSGGSLRARRSEPVTSPEAHTHHGARAPGHPEQIDVVPATADRWPDLATLFSRDGDRGCWCQYWRLSSSDFNRADHRASLHEQAGRDPAPGLLAYVDGEPAGWCSVGPRSQYERLVRSRTIPTVDDRPVWSIVCFKVRVGYRRRGVARALLAGAIDHARRQGAPALEAYPIDAEGRRIDVSFAYVGTASMFEAAGFRRVVETDARSAGRPRILMRLDL